MFCSQCGKKLNDADSFCSGCGNVTKLDNSKSNVETKVQINDLPNKSSKIIIPPEVKRWNWGAFVFTWIWGLSNKVYISLLMFLVVIPVIGSIFAFIFAIILGANGNAMAYKNQRAKSADDFLKSQRGWNTVALFFFFIPLSIGTIVLVIGLVLAGMGFINLSLFLNRIVAFLKPIVNF